METTGPKSIKTCPKCKVEKLRTEFYHSKGRISSRCKPCHIEQTEHSKKLNLKSREVHAKAASKWYYANPDKAKNSHVKRNYGITLDDYYALVIKANKCCQICQTTDVTKGHPKAKYWCIDHDHVTKKVRGILCQNCNRALGLLGDNILSIERALVYLKQSGSS